MKIFFLPAYIFVILCAIITGLVLPVTADTYSYEEQSNRFARINFHRSVLQADVVAVGEVAFVKADAENTRPLLQMLQPHIVFGDPAAENARQLGGDEAPEQGKVFLILRPKQVSSDTPLVFSGKRNLLFLKKIDADEGLWKQYSLPAGTILYEACDGWQSAVVLDFTRDMPALKILKERYSITDEKTLLQHINAMTSWRSLKTAPEQVTNLLNLINEHKNEQFYLDNVLPLLASLGVDVVEKDGLYVVKSDEQNPVPNTAQGK